MNLTDVKRLWSKIENLKVLVIGDIILDQYSYGRVSRISPEAPVPIFVNDHDEFYLGGSANVALNLKKLGSDVLLFGVVGSDLSKNTLTSLLKKSGINSQGLVVDPKRPTTRKKRVIANRQQLLRVDYENAELISKSVTHTLIKNILKNISNAHAIILVDYDKGSLPDILVKTVIKEARKKGIVVCADLKPTNKKSFIGVSMVAPNLKEGREMTGLHDVKEVGKALTKYFKSDVFLTRGEEGMSIFTKAGKIFYHPPVPGEVLDVSGAGDTVTAVATLGYVAKLPHEMIGFLANRAAGLAVQRRGTSSVSTEELLGYNSDK